MYQDNKHTRILRHYAKWTPLKEGQTYRDNDTGYTDAEITEVLKEYNELFKSPLKECLREYYRRENNPELKMNEEVLKQLGFNSCGRCKMQSIIDIQIECDEANMDQAIRDQMIEDMIDYDDIEWEWIMDDENNIMQVPLGYIPPKRSKSNLLLRDKKGRLHRPFYPPLSPPFIPGGPLLQQVNEGENQSQPE